jgi:hypothetical protein
VLVSEYRSITKTFFLNKNNNNKEKEERKNNGIVYIIPLSSPTFLLKATHKSIYGTQKIKSVNNSAPPKFVLLPMSPFLFNLTCPLSLFFKKKQMDHCYLSSLFVQALTVFRRAILLVPFFYSSLFYTSEVFTRCYRNDFI